MALIPPFFLDCVVAIGIQGQSNTNWIGTGFIVGKPFNDAQGNKLYHTFLVTNKHVLLNKQNIVLRFNSSGNTPVIDYPVSLYQNGQQIWIGHPSPDVDVATFFINSNILHGDQAQFGFFRLDEHVMNSAMMQNDGVSEGDGIFVLGFPLGIVGPQKNHVIARFGAISRIRDLFDGQMGPFLIDASIFPGNSGGPVIIKPEAMAITGTVSVKRAALIGIVKSYVPYKDVAVSQQTGNPRVIFEENSGLALVETVDTIEAAVNDCFQQKLANNP
ncbi:S1 family peptidase [Synechococcus sp. BDU 130192]|uniref:S1 family peptidase n=1 Tax=Synechococcus sp. BDU 130192 TaxID=2042059 RepID=UPI000C075559|nr:serine protease [Synechococcus sp. BDU 130192]